MQKEYARILVPQWEREHPNATQKECAEALGLSRQTVSTFTTRKRQQLSSEDALKIVSEWFDKNPCGSKAQCTKDLKINRKTVDKYYLVWKFQQELKKGSYEPTNERIAMFINSNT